MVGSEFLSLLQHATNEPDLRETLRHGCDGGEALTDIMIFYTRRDGASVATCLLSFDTEFHAMETANRLKAPTFGTRSVILSVPLNPDFA